MVSPLLLLVFVFSLHAVVWLDICFFDYKPGRALLDCEFVGLQNFTRMVSDKYALEELIHVMKNTFGMSFLGILTSPLPHVLRYFPFGD